MLQVCYVVVSSGWDHHSQMAWVSAQSVRHQQPDARIVMVVEGTAEGAEQTMRERFASVADSVMVKHSNIKAPVAKSRFHKIVLRNYIDGDFLYLDSDTLAVAPFEDAFDASG